MLHAPSRCPVEQGPWALVGQPCTRLQETPQLAGTLSEVPVTVTTTDVPLLLVKRHLSYHVALHDGGVGDPELASHEDHDRPRQVQRVGEERAQEAHGAELESVTQCRRVGPTPEDAHPIGIVQEEEPFQLLLSRRTDVAPVSQGLLV